MSSIATDPPPSWWGMDDHMICARCGRDCHVNEDPEGIELCDRCQSEEEE